MPTRKTVRKFSFISTGLMVLLVGCNRQSTEITGYVEGEFTYLSSPIGGTLKWLGVQRGEQVAPNQLLFRLDTEPEQSALNAAKQRTLEALGKYKDLEAPARATELGVIEGQIKQAKAQVQLTQARLKRIQTLYNKKFVAKDSLDAATSDFNSATAKVQSLQSEFNDAKLGGRKNAVDAANAAVSANAAEIKRAEWTVAQKNGIANDAARVFDTYYQVGEFVPAGRPIVSLLLPKDVHIVFYLSVAKMKSIQLGSEIGVQCSGCRDDLKAKITYISPVAEFTPPVIYSLENGPKLAFRILAQSNSVEGLHPGLPVTLELPRTANDNDN